MTEPESCWHCPECDSHIETIGPQKLIPLHRGEDGKRCEATGRSLIHYRWAELFKAVTGREPRA